MLYKTSDSEKGSESEREKKRNQSLVQEKEGKK